MKKIYIYPTILALLIGSSLSAVKAEPQSGQNTNLQSGEKANNYAPDNTGINTRDRDSAQVTPENQGMNKADTELVANIRRSLLENDSLSTYGRNIKIIAHDGVVTLRGPVKSAEEKDMIEQRTRAVAGAQKIQNELQVASSNEGEDKQPS